MNIKGRFEEAIKCFDAKDYKHCKNICDKILEKNGKEERAMALKGLSMFYINEKEEGKKCINEALKINMNSSMAWHFYAIYLKEDGKISQSLSCYNQANKKDPNNYSVIRDLGYLQLFLRQLNSFEESARKAIDIRPNNLINWVTYGLASALVKNYNMAIIALESIDKINIETLKKIDKFQIRLFIVYIKNLQGVYEEAMNYLLHWKNDFLIDKVVYYELIVKNALLNKKNNKTAMDYCNKLLEINCENIQYYLWYFYLKINDENLILKEYNDLLSLDKNNKYVDEMFKILTEDLEKKYPKSHIINKLKLSLSKNEQFKTLFDEYFLNQIKLNLPSCFKNVKFIYKYQKDKIPLCEEILIKYLTNIQNEKKINDELNNYIYISWAFFYASQHYLFLTDLEKSLKYINLAIDLLPSVVEYYMFKSKLLKHAFMINESCTSYFKAKELDTGDRYLNAKLTKIYFRLGNYEQAIEMTKEYIDDPLKEENIEYYQCLWMYIEGGNSYLENKKLLYSHYLIKNIFNTFNTIINDQLDLYNFSLRRYMVYDLYQTIMFLDNITKNKYLYKAIEKLDYLYSFLKLNKDEYEKIFDEEYKNLKNEYSTVKYKYTEINDLFKDIENDMYNMLKKMQNIVKNENIHLYCVKYFLIKKKVIFALKSLKYLKSVNHKSFYYYYSLKLFKEYLNNKENKIESEFENFINEFNCENLENWENNDKLEYIKQKIYDEGKFGNKEENKNNLNELLNAYNTDELRKAKNEIINELIVFVSLFTDKDGLEEFKKNLKEKMKIKNVSDDEINLNINFYEDKKEFDKEFVFDFKII